MIVLWKNSNIWAYTVLCYSCVCFVSSRRADDPVHAHFYALVLRLEASSESVQAYQYFLFIADGTYSARSMMEQQKLR